ncbi:hypothetical protein MIPYR_40052 [uncultured Microbacterium sp.]|uniref:Uncharacterized protein n=1 Tax=uncultured Microbacterium sp. TaxID=191216 RepID=A0A1Y5P3L0_9MICO|nr:hypothetical protein MIPYR_40052 [uncultured Microbacterium sp.]
MPRAEPASQAFPIDAQQSLLTGIARSAFISETLPVFEAHPMTVAKGRRRARELPASHASEDPHGGGSARSDRRRGHHRVRSRRRSRTGAIPAQQA